MKNVLKAMKEQIVTLSTFELCLRGTNFMTEESRLKKRIVLDERKR